ncbi:LamG domain-containing protein [Candidatus Altiarchaeota archaeon]
MSGSVSAAAPVIENVTLNSTFDTNLTSENLTVYYDVGDGDGDNVTNITNWFVNGTPIAFLNLPFEGGSNASFTRDYSPYGNNGTVAGATWNSSGGLGSSGAYEFNNDGITVANHPSIHPFSAITVEAWVKMVSSTGPYDAIVLPNGDDYYLQANWPKWRFYIINSTGVGGDAISDDNITLNRWYHLAGVYDGSDVRLYVDGVLQSDVHAITGPIRDSDQALLIGRSGIRQFHGSIDELRIYDIPLTPQQILVHNNSQSHTIISQQTRKDEVWQACITPNDGGGDGSEVCSNNVTILNTPPSISNVTLNSTNGTHFYWENLTLHFNASDDDSDSIKNITNWYMDGNSIIQLNMPFEAYSGDESSVAQDYSGFGNNGTVIGASWNSTGGYDMKGAYEFDAVGGYISAIQSNI